MAEQIAVAEAPAKKSKKGLLIVVAVAVLAGVAGALVFTGVVGGGTPEAVATEPAGPPPEGPVVDVATMTTNIGGEEFGYVKFGLAAVLAEGVTAELVGERFALLKDAALSEVASFTRADLESVEGLDRLRSVLTSRAQEIYPDGEILRIVLTELLVQ